MANNGNIEVDGFVKKRQELEKLMMSNPAMEKKVQGLIRKVLMQARRTMGQQAQSAMKTDPRQAYKAVKTAVYKRILGGSVSILDKRRAGAPGSYEPPRKLRPGQRGGNRVPRGQRTQQLMSYQGASRAFVLRFINQGTEERTAGTRGGGLSGNRGSIAARNFFSSSSHRAMQEAADQLTKLIDDMIKQEFNK
jgi:hypothetical protein